jgi:hypothetical protein
LLAAARAAARAAKLPKAEAATQQHSEAGEQAKRQLLARIMQIGWRM